MLIAMADLRVFGKTAKGTAELNARSGALSLSQRRLLILVDGVRDVEQLGTLVPSGLDDALRLLEDGGYIVLAGQSGRTVLAPEVSIPEPEVTTVREARMRAARGVTDLLGPAAADLAIAMEAAQSGDELRPLVRDAERLIAEFHGQAAAKAFILAIRRR
jgi:hypothetical protein